MEASTVLPTHHGIARSLPATLARNRVVAAYAGLVLLSAAVRLFGIGWGIPDYDPALLAHNPYRHTYHIDEDNFVSVLAFMHPSQGDFDVLDYHWGTLQQYTIYGVLVGT